MLGITINEIYVQYHNRFITQFFFFFLAVRIDIVVVIIVTVPSKSQNFIKRKKAIYSFIPILYIFSLILVQKTRSSSQQYMLLDWIHSLLLQILQHENKRYHITLPFSPFLGGGALFASLMRCGMFLLILEWNFSHIMHAPNWPKRRGKKKVVVKNKTKNVKRN